MYGVGWVNVPAVLEVSMGATTHNLLPWWSCRAYGSCLGAGIFFGGSLSRSPRWVFSLLGFPFLVSRPARRRLGSPPRLAFLFGHWDEGGTPRAPPVSPFSFLALLGLGRPGGRWWFSLGWLMFCCGGFG